MKKLIKFADDFKNLWEEFDKTIFSDFEIEKIINELKLKSERNEDYTTIENDFGVYVFFIKPHENFTNDSLLAAWREPSYSNYPKVAKTRFNSYKNININEVYPFYIGKSEKLGSRITEHFTHKGTTSTYSLKLKDRTLFDKNEITFAYWKLPKELENHPKTLKQFIITELEKKLRNKLMPWIGKQ
ncbi:hypothetical protein H9I45_00800 [Polaribacter haliotis]|uniref:GIY-YIG domain-containing protein n=2 Tax=Polaribacter TaxID=52959 RepID=A0A7L8AG68_9FLAO|nr:MULTISPECIES: hypothetical protein [Polaribacter]MDD7914116.1 hypothetical protein [Polaribacter sp. MSW5]QOD61008.1 hypothetical protein H9I45_00800 [Polaribacter haliotis]